MIQGNDDDLMLSKGLNNFKTKLQRLKLKFEAVAEFNNSAESVDQHEDRHQFLFCKLMVTEGGVKQ